MSKKKAQANWMSLYRGFWTRPGSITNNSSRRLGI